MTGVISTACEGADIPRSMHYEWLETDPAYRAQFTAVHEAVVDEAEAELKRRGIHGDDRPVFYRGEKCGSIREKSDACLIFYLKGRRGDIFRDRGEISGPGGGPIEHSVQVDLSKMPIERLRQIRQWMQEAALAQGEPAPMSDALALAPAFPATPTMSPDLAGTAPEEEDV